MSQVTDNLSSVKSLKGFSIRLSLSLCLLCLALGCDHTTHSKINPGLFPTSSKQPMPGLSSNTDRENVSRQIAGRTAEESQRAAPISKLINGLKNRLTTNPDDVQGWILLAKSYGFLGDSSNAQLAMEEARRRGYEGDIKLPEQSIRGVVTLPANHPPLHQPNQNDAVMNSLSELINKSS